MLILMLLFWCVHVYVHVCVITITNNNNETTQLPAFLDSLGGHRCHDELALRFKNYYYASLSSFAPMWLFQASFYQS